MKHLLRFVSRAAILVLFLGMPFINDAGAQITISVADIEPWYDRTLSVIDSNADTLSDYAAVQALINAEGANATYDFRGIPFTENFRGTLKYMEMRPDGPGGDIPYLEPSTMVMEISTETVEDVLWTTVWGFSEVRNDSIFQRGGIVYYDLLIELEDYESAADTMLFEPPTFSDPASYTYGDSWTAD